MKTMALILSLTALSAGLASCGKDDGARASAGKASAKAAQTVPLSTAPIDVVKTQDGMVSESFAPCVYDPGGPDRPFRVSGRYAGVHAPKRSPVFLRFQPV